MPELTSTSLQKVRKERRLDFPTQKQTVQSDTDTTYVTGIKRVVYIGLASLFFALGMIGIVLPGLPTTPFLLLTSYYLARSWPRMNRMLLANRFIGPILQNWKKHRGLETRTKIQAISMVCIAIILVCYFARFSALMLTMTIALACVGIFVIALLPSVKLEA